MIAKTFLTLLIALSCCENVTSELQEWNWNPDNENIAHLPFDLNWEYSISDAERRRLNEITRDTEDGDIRGLSIPGVHDTSSFVNMFLGIPYAHPPIDELRFKVGQQKSRDSLTQLL